MNTYSVYIDGHLHGTVDARTEDQALVTACRRYGVSAYRVELELRLGSVQRLRWL